MSNKENDMSYTLSFDSSIDGDLIYSTPYTVDTFDYSFYEPVPPKLKCFKLFPQAHLPTYGSDWAACFDLKASLRPGDAVKVYDITNNKTSVEVDMTQSFVLYSGQRALVPTGLIFDLESGQSLRIHPRSGLALKNGIIVANCEGIVDADYVEQSYVMLHNISDIAFEVKDGDRIAQGEVVNYTTYNIVEVDDRPAQKTNRDGGFGSTGTK